MEEYKDWYDDDWTKEDEDDIENEFSNELSFNDFLNEAEVILVDNAFDFDINKWEKENQEEINEELSEDINNITNTTTPQFIKYQLTPDKVKEIVNKIINSEFNIVNYWKTNQFKKKNNLTDDDLKDILKTLTEQDYKTNSISIDKSKNEAIIFIKQTNIKNLSNIEIYIKLDYDSIEHSPVIVLSFHSKRQKKQLTSSYKTVNSLKENKLLKKLDNKYYQANIKEAVEDEDSYLNKLDIKSNGIYSINKGWLKHPTQETIPDVDMEEFEKEFKVWEDRYFDLLDKISLEQIDDLIEDIYNLRKEGMEEEGEYSIKNLIFKEFRNLGYLDNLKELRKKEISKELSLEQLNEDIEDINEEDEKDIIDTTLELIDDYLSFRANAQAYNFITLDYILDYDNVFKKQPSHKDFVQIMVPYILFENTPYKIYYTDLFGWEGSDYIITKKETSLKSLYVNTKLSFEEEEEEISPKDFEDHVFTVDQEGNYKKVKL